MPSILTRPSGGGSSSPPTVTASASNLSPSIGDVITLTATGTGFDLIQWTINSEIVGTGTPFSYTVGVIGDPVTVVCNAFITANGTYATDSVDLTVNEVLADTLFLVNDDSVFDLNGTKVIRQNGAYGQNGTEQLNVSQQPTYDATGINGLQCVKYGDSTAHNMLGAATIGVNNSMHIVFRPYGALTNEPIFWIAGSYNDSSTPYMGIRVGDSPAYSGKLNVYERAAGHNLLQNIDISISTTYLIQVRRTATYLEVYLNGLPVFIPKLTSDTGNRSVGVFLGNAFNYGSGEIFMGHAEVVDRYITDIELNAKATYLMDKWSI